MAGVLGKSIKVNESASHLFPLDGTFAESLGSFAQSRLVNPDGQVVTLEGR